MSHSTEAVQERTGDTEGVSDAELDARFRPIFELIAENAAEHEADGSLLHEEVRLLAEAGFGALRLPRELGGSGASIPQLFRLLVELGEADSNQPQAWRNHFAFVEDRLAVASPIADRHWLDRVAAGAIVGGAWSERGSAPLDRPDTRVRADGDRWILDGTKYYSTGSIYSDLISVAASDEEGRSRILVVETGAPGVEILDDWTGIGQRQTGSGTARFTGVVVPEHGNYPFEERAATQEPFYQLILLAALAGVGRAARRDLVAALRARARSYGHGLADAPRDDAQLLQVVGQVAARAFAAEAAVARAAAVLETATEAALDGGDSIEATTAAAVATYEAQITVAGAVLEATTLLYDALGSSALDRSTGLDRHWRNARTIASHNPRVYKERVVGAWYVNGTSPLDVWTKKR